MPAGSAKASIHWAVEESEFERRDGGVRLPSRSRQLVEKPFTD